VVDTSCIGGRLRDAHVGCGLLNALAESAESVVEAPHKGARLKEAVVGAAEHCLGLA